MRLEMSAREFWGKHFLIGIIGKGKAPSTRFLEARQLFYHHEEARLSREKKRGGIEVLDRGPGKRAV